MFAEERPPADSLDRRRAGILLHITSLPGGLHCGDLGPSAYHFVNFLVDCGMSVWQMLPVGPPFEDGSPYQTRSVHAGNPQFISLDPLFEGDWRQAVPEVAGEAPAANKARALRIAWEGFEKGVAKQDPVAVEQFARDNAYWLDDYALFRVLSAEHKGGWWTWPEALRHRDPEALADARERFAAELRYIAYEQYLFFSQWQALKAHANGRGVKLFGDMPIFVAHDSAEVWARPQDFDLNEDGTKRVVAGVPPDYFAAEGQRWGNPLYRWEKMQADGFRFWMDRIRTQLTLYDMVRIDHFRGFAACWEIPSTEPLATKGRWVRSLGDELFERLHQRFGRLPLIAEDLGTITEDVEALRKKYHLPGMKVLQFGFDGDPNNPHLPFHFDRDSVVYSGTHDNDTTGGWYASLDDHTRWLVDEFIGWPQEPMPWPMIRQAFASRSHLAMLPMQDVLGLGGGHRMNRPGTSEGNWQWRFSWDQVQSDVPAWLNRVAKMYGR